MLGVDDLWWFLSAGGRVKYEYNFSRDRRPEPSQVHYAHRPFIDSMSVYLICISCACAHVLMLLYFICFQKLLKYLCGDPTIDVQFWGPHTSRDNEILIWVRFGHLKIVKDKRLLRYQPRNGIPLFFKNTTWICFFFRITQVFFSNITPTLNRSVSYNLFKFTNIYVIRIT